MSNVDRFSKYLTLILMLSLLPLISAYRWEQRIDLNMVTYSSTSTSWVPSTSATYLGLIEFDFSKYDNVGEIYYEVEADSDYSGIPNGVGGCQTRLYDVTNSADLSESAYYVSGIPAYRRSGNITYLFGKASLQLMPQVKADASTTCYLYHSTLVIVQNGNITKTRIMIPVGVSASESDTCGTPEEDVAYPKKWNWSNSDFSGNINVTFSATLKATALSGLIKLTNSTTNVASLFTSSTGYNYSKSANFSLFNNEIISVGLCRILTATVTSRNAFIVVDQSNIDPSNPKTLSIIQTDVDLRQTTLETPQYDLTQRSAFNDTNFQGVNLNPKLSCTMLQSAGGNDTAFCNFRQTSGGEEKVFPNNASVTNVSFKHGEASLGKDTKFVTNIGAGLWDNATGGIAQLSSSRVIFYISGLKCWSFDSTTKILYVPSGCQFYTTGKFGFTLGDE